MVLVKIKDKRHQCGFRIKYFQTDAVNDEIIEFVCRNKKAYWIGTKEDLWTSRGKFLESFNITE